MKILVVEDDKLMLKAIVHNLNNKGYKTLTAEDGFRALDMIQKEEIDLIISDIMMPNISGLALLNLLKQFYYNNIPVILISSLDKGDIISRSLGLGATDFITKPIDFDRLFQLIDKYTKVSR